MKVVLLRDVPNVGQAGTVHEVSDGFARNYLIPRRLAEPATPERVAVAEARLAAQRRKVEKAERALRDLAQRLEGLRVVIPARVGESGRLYGSITARDIAERVSRLVGHEIDRRAVELTDPIRSLGEHRVSIHLVGRLRPTVIVEVVPEESSEQSQ
ncbi:MAG: 50S ribosomal protein L9 [Thermomicrobium sp.]|nr:50S ribosomal protein L9 [Thermomicrobium sp.]MDW7981671.1 50S ribosomal protein L9 [Thermomicrobium sp.]